MEANAVIEAIFTLKNIAIYFFVINILAFLAMAWDKHEAKVGDWRIKGAIFIGVTWRWNWRNSWNVHF